MSENSNDAKAGGSPSDTDTFIAIRPYNRDPIVYLAARILGLSPFRLALGYFFVSFVVTYLIGYVTGQYHGKNGIGPMYGQILDNLNLAFLAPVGAGLLCHLYVSIANTFDTVQNKGLVRPADHERLRLVLTKARRFYDSKTAVIVCFGLSAIINIFNYLNKTDSWLAINGGLTGIYGRFWIFINFTMIFLIFYKCVVTVWAMQKTMELDLKIEPMHPDRSGGLKCFGQLSMAVNYFLSLVMVFFTLLLVFDDFSRGQPLYVLFFIVFYVVAIYSFFASLSKAHGKMKAEKDAALNRLENIACHHYKRFASQSQERGNNTQTLQDMTAVDAMYTVVQKMPVWPFDVAHMKQFVTTIAFPMAMFLYDQLRNADSALWKIINVLSDKLGSV